MIGYARKDRLLTGYKNSADFKRKRRNCKPPNGKKFPFSAATIQADIRKARFRRTNTRIKVALNKIIHHCGEVAEWHVLL